MENSRILLPRYFRFIGLVLFIASSVMNLVRFGYGYKPEWLETKVFVVYAAYLQTSGFRFITNNISEEICGITMILSLLFLGFSKFRNESAETWKIRTRALVLSVYTTMGILIFCLMFIYGWGFLMVMTANLALPFLVYVIFLYLLYYRYKLELDEKL